jgi:hypothetical protein
MTLPDDYGDFLDPPEAAFWLEPDFVLTSIVASLVNLMELPIGVTIFVNGMMLSGTLVSEREYLDSLTHLFRETARESLASAPGAGEDELDDAFDFTLLAESALGRDPDAPVDSDDEFDGAGPIRFLHIKNISVLSPQPAIAFSQSTFPYVRIRINAIGGWMLGHAMPFDTDLPLGEGEPRGEPPILH